jgi:hypothetical protein
MIFNYKDYIEELKNSYEESKKETYKAWLKNKGKTDYKKEKYYKYHLNIEPIKYRVPIELQNDFDYDLLLRLVAVSISSSYDFVFPNPETTDQSENIDLSIPDLVIHVESGNKRVSRSIHELYSFQINRLYEIYFNEMINLWQIRRESGGTKGIVHFQIMAQIKAYDEKINIAKKYEERIKCFEL